jgi:hypothetical protein
MIAGPSVEFGVHYCCMSDFEHWPLHDAVLYEIRLEWKARTCDILVAAFVDRDQRAQRQTLHFTEVTSAVVPHADPWGPSVFINKQSQGADGAYLIEVQSGDVIAIHAAAVTFEPTIA